MDYYVLVGIFTIFFNGLGGVDTTTDAYKKITRSTEPPSARIYKPIDMSDSIKFDNWSEAIKSAKSK